jgi:hypothetical protein
MISPSYFFCIVNQSINIGGSPRKNSGVDHIFFNGIYPIKEITLAEITAHETLAFGSNHMPYLSQM